MLVGAERTPSAFRYCKEKILTSDYKEYIIFIVALRWFIYEMVSAPVAEIKT